jgi:hypothetical protein
MTMKSMMMTGGLTVVLGMLVFGPRGLWDRVELMRDAGAGAVNKQTSTEDLVELRKKELQAKAEEIRSLKQRIYDEEGLLGEAHADIEAAREKLAAEEDVLVHARLKLASTGDAILVGSRQYSRAEVEGDVNSRLKLCESLRTRIERKEEQVVDRTTELEEMRTQAGTEETALELAFQDLETMKARALNAEAKRKFRQEINTLLASAVSSQASAAEAELIDRIDDVREPRPAIDWSEGPTDLTARLDEYFEQHVQSGTAALQQQPLAQATSSK